MVSIFGRVAAEPPIGMHTNQAHIDRMTFELDRITFEFDERCGSLDPMLLELMKNSNLQEIMLSELKNSNLQEMLSIIQQEQSILLPLQYMFYAATFTHSTFTHRYSTCFMQYIYTSLTMLLQTTYKE